MRGFAVWFTGLPGSGKTTLAYALKEELEKKGLRPVILDGDDVREWLTPKVGFNREGRKRNVLRVAKVASLIVESGGIAIVALVSPYGQDREDAIKLIGECQLVYLYGRQGKLWYKTVYEIPQGNFLPLNTAVRSVKTCIGEIIRELERMKFIAPRHSDAPSLLLGRWQPFHEGHKALVRKVLDEGKSVVIGIRDTPLGQSNPYTFLERWKQICSAFPNEVDSRKVKVVLVPNFSEICIGRTPGYGIRQIHLGEKTESISGTEIRKHGERG